MPPLLIPLFFHPLSSFLFPLSSLFSPILSLSFFLSIQSPPLSHHQLVTLRKRLWSFINSPAVGADSRLRFDLLSLFSSIKGKVDKKLPPRELNPTKPVIMIEKEIEVPLLLLLPPPCPFFFLLCFSLAFLLHLSSSLLAHLFHCFSLSFLSLPSSLLSSFSISTSCFSFSAPTTSVGTKIDHSQRLFISEETESRV